MHIYIMFSVYTGKKKQKTGDLKMFELKDTSGGN